jgi:hypothetical protein
MAAMPTDESGVDLWQEWRARPPHANESFITDGIIDPQRWARAPRRVMFLLKEAYDRSPSRQGFDLPEWLRTAPEPRKGQTWKNAGRWAYLLQRVEPGHIPEPPSEEEGFEALLGAAIVNVKKSGGRSRSDAEDIARYAQDDSDLLRRQVEGIAPDVVVTGGTWAAAQSILGGSSFVMHRCHRSKELGLFLLNFWHPAAQLHRMALYYALGGIAQVAIEHDLL